MYEKALFTVIPRLSENNMENVNSNSNPTYPPFPSLPDYPSSSPPTRRPRPSSFYPTPRTPATTTSMTLEDYHQQAVEEYVGTGGKEYETAAEKIVEGYMGAYMDKYMNEWYMKYCRDTGKYCDQIKVKHHHKSAQDEEQRQNDPSSSQTSYPPNHSSFPQNEPSYNNHDHHKAVADHMDNSNDHFDNSYFDNSQALADQQLLQQIEADKHNHHFNSNGVENNLQDSIMPIWSDDRYHNKQNQDNHFFPNPVKSSPAQKPHNFHGGPASSGMGPGYSNPDFEFFEPARHKLLTKEKGRKRLRKHPRRKKPRLSHHQGVRSGSVSSANPVPSYDAYLDLDYIEEMFAGNAAFDDYSMFEQKPPLQPLQPPARYNGYSMIEETDIDDRAFSSEHRLF